MPCVLPRPPAQFRPTTAPLQSLNAAAVDTSAVEASGTVNLFNTGGIQGRSGACNGGAGTDTLVNSGQMIGDVFLGQGDDSFDGRGGRIDGQWFGDVGNDRYNGRGATLISGSVGGGEGSDTPLGGDGAETIFGEAADDVLRGGGGDDVLIGGQGFDQMWGEDGNDALTGGQDADDLQGGAGDHGGAGDDTLTGGAQGDLLAGGTGADMFVLAALAGSASPSRRGTRFRTF